jgi:hypothetical protein
MLWEVSKRMLSVGDTFSSFFFIKDGFKLNERMSERVTRRRKEISIALGWPNRLRSIQYWRAAKVSPTNKRTRITHKEKTGDKVI